MADYGLFQTPSPDEIQAQEQDQQTALQSQGPAGQNLAAILNFGGKIGGNPQLAKAQQLQQALQRAMADSGNAADGQDDISAQMARIQKMRDAVVSIDPSIASKLNISLLKLQSEKLERQKLQAQTDRENALTAASQQGLAANAPSVTDQLDKTQAYVFDPASGKTQAFDLSKPENAPAFEKAKSTPNAVVMNGQERVQMLREQLAKQSAMDLVKLKLAAANSASAGSGLDPATLHTAALVSLSDPSRIRDYASFGKAGDPTRHAIANEQQKIMDEAGITGSDLTQMRAQIAAQRGNAAQLQKSLGTLSAFEAVARNNGQRVLDLADKLDLGSVQGADSIPATAALQLAVQKGLLGQADAAEYASVLKTFQFEAARILTAGPTLNGVVSDTARKEMEDIVKGDMPLPAFTRVVQRLLTEMEIRRTGLANELQNSVQNSVAVRENGAGQLSLQGGPAPAGNAPPVAAPAQGGGQAAPEGTILYKDGKPALIKRNGQWAPYGQ